MTMTNTDNLVREIDLQVQQLRAVRTRLLRFLDLVQQFPTDGTEEYAIVQADLVKHIQKRLTYVMSNIDAGTRTIEQLASNEEAEIERGRRRAIEALTPGQKKGDDNVVQLKPMLDDVWDDGIPVWVNTANVPETGRLSMLDPNTQYVPRQ